MPANKNTKPLLHDTTPINSGKTSNHGYIVNKAYDSIWFIGAPAIGLIAAYFFLNTELSETQLFKDTSQEHSIYELFLGSFIMAHLFIVFFRSHANPSIFALHPIRFLAVPVILIASITYSIWAAVIISVIATWWDVYHSGLQTFGLGRIYDMRAGNNSEKGRRLDYLLNTLIYLGPILAGASLMEHVKDFKEFDKVGFKTISTELPAFIFNHSNTLTQCIFAIGIPFIIYYLYAYWQLKKQGYIVSTKKVLLLVSTAIVSMFCWGFNSFGEAFFVMNFFHAWQYFAIVWAFEKKHITSLFCLSGVKFGTPISLILFTTIAFSYGIWVTLSIDDSKFIYALILTVSILHFWYDGFIWSVKKKQV